MSRDPGRLRGWVRAVRSRTRRDRHTTERLDRQHHRIATLERDLARIGPQLAALEARVEDLRATVATPGRQPAAAVPPPELVQEVRREHERIRARVSAAARFEERLAQLEDQMAALGRSTRT